MNKDDDYDESDEKTASSDDDNNGIIIIGGGLAGLAAAVQMETKNVPYVLLRSSDGLAVENGYRRRVHLRPRVCHLSLLVRRM